MVGMKGGFTDGKNSRETFRDRKTARAIVDNAQEQKHQMEMQMQKRGMHLMQIWKRRRTKRY